METHHTDLHATEDHELNLALERAEELDGLSVQHQRLARIQEYEEMSLARSDPFTAVLGMGTSHLAKIFEHFGTAILEELESQAPTVAALRELGPEFRMLLKLRSAIETDIEFQHDVIGEQPMVSPRTTRNGPLNKRAVRQQSGVVSRHPRSNT